MALRKRTYKKRTYRKRRTYRRRTFKKTFNRHSFKKTTIQEITVTNAGFVPITSDGTNYNRFHLDYIANYTEMTNLFDSYKINGIRRKYVFNRNSSEVSTGVELPFLVTVNDYNDTAALTSEAEATEYSTYKASRLDKPRSRFFKPTQMIAKSADNQVVRRRWNPSNEADIWHMGIKEAVQTIDSSTGTTLGTLKVYTTFYLSFMTPH